MTEKQVEQTQQQSEISQSLLSKLNTPIFKTFLSFSILSILITSFYSFWLHKQYQKTLISYLPASSTVAYIETNPQLVSSPKLSQILQLESQFLNQTSLSDTLQKPVQKNISLQFYNQKTYPVFLYRLSNSQTSSINFPVQITELTSDKTWKYSLKGNLLVISESPELNKIILSNQKDSIYNNQLFQDSFVNIPQQNLASFSINHSLLKNLSNDPLFPNNSFSNLIPIIDQLGFTTANIVEKNNQIIVNTYSNSADSKIKLSPTSNLQRYSKNLLQADLPTDIQYLYHGNNLSSLVLNFLDNQAQSNSNQFKNYLTQQGFSEDGISLLVSLFQQEYLIYKQEGSNSINILFPKQNLNQQQLILDELSKVEAFYNPQLTYKTLPDNSVISYKVPSDTKPRELNYEANIYTFNFQEKNQSIQIDFQQQDYDLVRIFTDSKLPQIQTEQTNQFELNPIHKEATSLTFYQVDYLKEKFPNFDFILNQFNSVLSSSYFFDDGIQITFQLYEE